MADKTHPTRTTYYGLLAAHRQEGLREGFALGFAAFKKELEARAAQAFIEENDEDAEMLRELSQIDMGVNPHPQPHHTLLDGAFKHLRAGPSGDWDDEVEDFLEASDGDPS